MDTSTSDLPSLATRVERLEQLVKSLVEQLQVKPEPVVIAEEFVLVDREGKPRARFAMAENMEMRVEDGTKKVPDFKGPILLFLDQDGFSSNYLQLTSSGAILRFSDRQGNETVLAHNGLGIGDPQGNQTVITHDSVGIFDADGFAARLGKILLVKNLTGEHRDTSVASLVLIGKDDKVIWSAP
jgi:hypothetical protein